MKAAGDPNTPQFPPQKLTSAQLKRLNIALERNDSVSSVSYTPPDEHQIRHLFDEAYVIKSDLRGYNKANAEFLVKCDAFSKQPARELKLSSDIESYYTPGLPITSLFKSKQQTLLKELEYMTNPIDLTVRINDVINSLAQFFGSEVGVLSFDDTLTLFLGLMSQSPPANAVAIAKFIEKWSELLLSEVTKNSKNFYLAAIDHILKLEAVQVADDTKEFFR